MIYSSVKEVETFVGSNVSFHTFMTAINNPRSKIYTEKINASPYHGINCKAYYGTVCSDLVSYTLGLSNPRYGSFDFEQSKMMEMLEEITPENLKLADVLWKKGHVAIITDIVKGEYGIQSDFEKRLTDKVNESETGPLGLGGKHSVLTAFAKIGPQRASGVRIVALRPCCCFEPRRASVEI